MVKLNKKHKRKVYTKSLSKPISSRVFKVVGPYRMQEYKEKIQELPVDCLLLETRLTGICQADLRYVSCSRPQEILDERLPLCVFHEGIAKILDLGDNVKNFTKGDLVVVVPNIPCYIHNPDKYPDIDRACSACRPEGIGENFCEDVKFLGSNTSGLSRTHFIHLASFVLPIPGSVPEEVAVLTEPLTVINRAIKKLKITSSDRVAVLGGGFMGFITVAILSKIIGISKPNLLVTDIYDSKLEKFRDFANVANIKDKTFNEDLLSSFNYAFECAGGRANESTIEQALSLLTIGGTCMLIGVRDGKTPIQTRIILEKGLTLKGTTRSAATDYAEVLEWLKINDFRRSLQRIIFPKKFVVKDCDSIISACKIAKDKNIHEKVIIDWRKEFEK